MSEFRHHDIGIRNRYALVIIQSVLRRTRVLNGITAGVLQEHVALATAANNTFLAFISPAPPLPVGDISYGSTRMLRVFGRT